MSKQTSSNYYMERFEHYIDLGYTVELSQRKAYQDFITKLRRSNNITLNKLENSEKTITAGFKQGLKGNNKD